MNLEYLTKGVNLSDPLDVIAIVVTGKVKDIKTLEDNKNIKASVLGYTN